MLDQQTTNHPTHRLVAVALSADADKSPVVVAKGYGAVAEAIIDRARAHGLYVHTSPELVKLLMNVNLDGQIPPQLYAAIAELFVWLHDLEADATAKQA